MANKVTIKMCMDLEFTRSPEQADKNISDIETKIDSLMENMAKAKEIADYIVKGDSKFSLELILKTFFDVNQVSIERTDLHTTVYYAPFMTITERYETEENPISGGFITYQNMNFPCRFIPDLENEGAELLIAPQSLSQIITLENGEIRKEDVALDETICYYASPEEMKLSDEELYNTIYH